MLRPTLLPSHGATDPWGHGGAVGRRGRPGGLRPAFFRPPGLSAAFLARFCPESLGKKPVNAYKGVTGRRRGLPDGPRRGTSA